MGMPVRVTVGNALAKEGVVEVKERRTPRREQRVPRDQVVATLAVPEVLLAPVAEPEPGLPASARITC